MILGVDHLHIAVPVLAESGVFLEGLGYQKEFEQEDLFGGGEDGVLYGGRGKSIAYYQAADGAFSVELINCRAGSSGGSDSVYRPFFRGVVAATAEDSVDGAVLCPSLQIHCCAGEPPGGDGAHGVLDTIAVRTWDLERGERFWRDGLGFGVAKEGAGGRRVLEMEQNLIGSRVRLLLEACTEERSAFEFIDDPGCVVLAFMTTDLARDMERLRAHGGRAHGNVIRVCVNRRELTAGFAVGPCGEHVELIQWA